MEGDESARGQIFSKRDNDHIEVIAIREVLPDRLTMVPRADFVIKDSDLLVIIGKETDIQKIG